jgi:hypothetical protein
VAVAAQATGPFASGASYKMEIIKAGGMRSNKNFFKLCIKIQFVISFSFINRQKLL